MKRISPETNNIFNDSFFIVKDVIQSIPSVFKQRNKRKNAVRFLRFGFILVLFVGCYMQFYMKLMSEELGGVNISWVESFYWVLTTMSTLGYGDITFKEDAGRLFSMMVMFTEFFISLLFFHLCSWNSYISLLWSIKLVLEWRGSLSQ